MADKGKPPVGTRTLKIGSDLVLVALLMVVVGTATISAFYWTADHTDEMGLGFVLGVASTVTVGLLVRELLRWRR